VLREWNEINDECEILEAIAWCKERSTGWLEVANPCHRDVVLGICTRTAVQLKYKFLVLVLGLWFLFGVVLCVSQISRRKARCSSINPVCKELPKVSS